MKEITYKDLTTTLEVLRAIAKDNKVVDRDKLYLLYKVEDQIKDMETLFNRWMPNLPSNL